MTVFEMKISISVRASMFILVTINLVLGVLTFSLGFRWLKYLYHNCIWQM